MNLKQRMQNGKCAFGTWSMLSNASVVDVIACSGIDFVVIDMEHGSIGWETAESMTSAWMSTDHTSRRQPRKYDSSRFGNGLQSDYGTECEYCRYC